MIGVRAKLPIQQRRHPLRTTKCITINQYQPQPQQQQFSNKLSQYQNNLSQPQQQQLQGGEQRALTRAPQTSVPVRLTWLPSSEVLDKEVVTRAEGLKLGVLTTAYVNRRTLQVAYFKAEQRNRALMVVLDSFYQIGDVVLVEDAAAVGRPLTNWEMCTELCGCDVMLANRKYLGKVTGFVYSPDNGDIQSIMFDEINFELPRRLRVRLFNQFLVPGYMVYKLGQKTLVLYDDAEQYVVPSEQPGILSSIIKFLNRNEKDQVEVDFGGAFLESGQEDYESERGKWEEEIRQWEQQTGLRYDEWLRDQDANRNQQDQYGQLQQQSRYLQRNQQPYQLQQQQLQRSQQGGRNQQIRDPRADPRRDGTERSYGGYPNNTQPRQQTMQPNENSRRRDQRQVQQYPDIPRNGQQSRFNENFTSRNEEQQQQESSVRFDEYIKMDGNQKIPEELPGKFPSPLQQTDALEIERENERGQF